MGQILGDKVELKAETSVRHTANEGAYSTGRSCYYTSDYVPDENRLVVSDVIHRLLLDTSKLISSR